MGQSCFSGKGDDDGELTTRTFPLKWSTMPNEKSIDHHDSLDLFQFGFRDSNRLVVILAPAVLQVSRYLGVDVTAALDANFGELHHVSDLAGRDSIRINRADAYHGEQEAFVGIDDLEGGHMDEREMALEIGKALEIMFNIVRRQILPNFVAVGADLVVEGECKVDNLIGEMLEGVTRGAHIPAGEVSDGAETVCRSRINACEKSLRLSRGFRLDRCYRPAVCDGLIVRHVAILTAGLEHLCPV